MRINEEEHKDLAVPWFGRVHELEGGNTVLVDVWECDCTVLLRDYLANVLYAAIVSATA